MGQPNQKLLAARLRLQLSQTDVAEKVGVSPKTVYRWERGSAAPSLYYQRRLCDVLGVNPSDLGLGADTTALPLAALPLVYDPLIASIRATDIIGREQDLAALEATCQPGTLTCLTGLPGVGKTSLARLMVQRPACMRRFPAGILWAELGPQGLALTALLRWRGLLGRDTPLPTDPRDPLAICREELIDLMADQPWLIVLDDAWDAAQIAPLLSLGPHCGLLVTTRSAEVAQRLPAARVVTVPPLTAQESTALLHQLLPPAFAIDLAPLVDLAGGLPLALKIFGQHLAQVAQTQQSRRVQQAFERLADPSQRVQVVGIIEGRSTPLSLATAIAHSVQALSPTAQTLFACLAVLPTQPQRFREAAALAVGAAPAEALDEIVDAGLLVPVDDGWYQCHQLVHDAARLWQPLDVAAQRMIAYVNAQAHIHLARGQALTEEEATIRAACFIAQELGWISDLVGMLSHLNNVYLVQGALSSLWPWWSDLEVQTRASTDHAVRGKILESLGLMAALQGDAVRGLDAFQQAYQAYAKVPDAEKVVSAGVRILITLTRLGRYTEAVATLASLSDWLTQLPAQGYRAQQVLQAQVNFAYGKGEFPTLTANRVRYLQSLEAADINDDVRRMINYAALAQGQLHEVQTDLEEWTTHLDPAQRGPLDYALWYGLQASWWLARGDLEQARSTVHEGLRFGQEGGDQDALSEIQLIHLRIAVAGEAFTEIPALVEQLLAHGKGEILWETLLLQGMVALKRDQLHEAYTHFQAAERQIDPLAKPQLALLHWGYAQWAWAVGDHERAQREAHESLRLYETMGHTMTTTVQQWLDQHRLENIPQWEDIRSADNWPQ